MQIHSSELESLHIFNSKIKYLFKFKTATVETVAKCNKGVWYWLENVCMCWFKSRGFHDMKQIIFTTFIHLLWNIEQMFATIFKIIKYSRRQLNWLVCNQCRKYFKYGQWTSLMDRLNVYYHFWIPFKHSRCIWVAIGFAEFFLDFPIFDSSWLK